MLAEDRRQLIKDLVFEKKAVKVTELAKKFSVTDETIRRDLNILEEQGVLMRGYGGAFIQTGVENIIDSEIKQTVYKDSKERIASICDELIQNGDVIFLDTSTTAYYVAEKIMNKRLTVVTNSLRIINLLTRNPELRVVAIGGQYNNSDMGFFGLNAIKTLNEYFVDKAFLTCRSLSIENGLTDSSEDFAELKAKVIERSQESYIIADFSKFDNTSFIKVAGFESITGIITDKELGLKWHDKLKSINVKIFDK